MDLMPLEPTKKELWRARAVEAWLKTKFPADTISPLHMAAKVEKAMLEEAVEKNQLFELFEPELSNKRYLVLSLMSFLVGVPEQLTNLDTVEWYTFDTLKEIEEHLKKQLAEKFLNKTLIFDSNLRKELPFTLDFNISWII